MRIVIILALLYVKLALVWGVKTFLINKYLQMERIKK